MRVNVKAEFISPLLNFSEKKINFYVLKVRTVFVRLLNSHVPMRHQIKFNSMKQEKQLFFSSTQTVNLRKKRSG